jgi:soluble lytic murein transglycosylase-like protein
MTGRAPACGRGSRNRLSGDAGQALVALLGGLLLVVGGAAGLALLAAGVSAHGARQRAADLGALGAARALLDLRPRALEPPASRRHLTPVAYRERVRATAVATARANGARAVRVTVGAGPLPDRVTVVVDDAVVLPAGVEIAGASRAVAAVADGVAPVGDGEYQGPFAQRQGKPMRPDVALAFDRLAGAARRAGHRLLITSAFRTNAEQARLFAARPDPRWVARPGTSLHRLGTELDLGPASAYAWLAAHAGRFGFIKRYAWEPWHFGFGRSPGSASVGFAPPPAATHATGAVPAFVPAQLAPLIRRAASRWSVGAALLAAQLQQESGFRPTARSPAGALGIAQFMPATARAYGLRDPFDPAQAIDAQARLMRDLLRRFGSVPLALAAYNAGPGRVAACRCVPPIPETQAYVQRVVALARGFGGGGPGGPPVRLVA